MEGDFLACGSETNDVFVYHKALSKPVAHESFAVRRVASGAVPINCIGTICCLQPCHALASGWSILGLLCLQPVWLTMPPMPLFLVVA